MQVPLPPAHQPNLGPGSTISVVLVAVLFLLAVLAFYVYTS